MTSGMNMKLTNVKDRFYANKCPHSIAYISSVLPFTGTALYLTGEGIHTHNSTYVTICEQSEQHQTNVEQ